MTTDDRDARLQRLREPFPENQIGKLPKPTRKNAEKGKCRECGGWHGLPAVHLDYVGHAALTDRLLDVDPEWTWEPLAYDEHGLPRFDRHGGLWIKLTICGVTRLGYGDAEGKQGANAVKEAIGDALRNSGMRFGAALDLWHKGELHEAAEARGSEDRPAPDPEPEPEPGPSTSEFAEMIGKVRACDSAVTLKKAWDYYAPHLTEPQKAELKAEMSTRLEAIRAAESETSDGQMELGGEPGTAAA
ncbi:MULTISPECIES: hypothetical protein [Rhodococcus]|uniref:hypothetical protein n=1 Tax=Rhodococcus TaxID=1827 RepID=UPI001D187519|nr:MULTISPECIES: hypothetical protein [Rhodococcus]